MVFMTLTDLPKGTLDVDCDEVWANERASTVVKVFKYIST